MSDRQFEPMSEYETRLSRELRAASEHALRSFDATAITRTAAIAQPKDGGSAGAWIGFDADSPRRSSDMARAGRGGSLPCRLRSSSPSGRRRSSPSSWVAPSPWDRARRTASVAQARPHRPRLSPSASPTTSPATGYVDLEAVHVERATASPSPFHRRSCRSQRASSGSTPSRAPPRHQRNGTSSTADRATNTWAASSITGSTPTSRTTNGPMRTVRDKTTHRYPASAPRRDKR